MSRRFPVALALASVLAACGDQHVPPTAPQNPATVGDAALGVAPPSAAFLAPLGTGAPDSAAFDATAAPVVKICAWDGSACTAAPVAVFSTTPGGTALPLAINTTIGRYEASWNLLDARFLTRQTYRIQVMRGTTELGAVSVDVVRGRWALTRTDGTLAPLAAAGTLPIRFTITSSNHAPAATIARPAPDAAFAVGAAVAFEGSGTDAEDGPLTGASLVWTSDRDGEIGTGTSFSVTTLSAGTHVVTLTATDASGAHGTATVTIVVNPSGPGPLTNGATATGRIDAAGQVDRWTFTAGAGDHVVLSLGETSSSSDFAPWLRVIGPDGVTVLGSNFGLFAAQLELSAPAAGSYSVLVASADAGGDGTGDYLLTLIEAPGALSVSSGDQGGLLTSGATQRGSIYTGDVDGWTFTVGAGDHAVIGVGETGATSGLVPWIRVVGPAGTVVGSNFGFTAAQVDLGALAAGTYTVIVGSAGGGFTGTGDYLLTMIEAPGAMSVSSGDQGGVLADGATRRGTIYDGDIDGWTFTAKAGDHAVVSVGETGVTTDFVPWVRVIGPDGASVGSNFGFTAAQVELSALAAGTYTVIVGSAGGGFTGSGDYLLTLIRAPGALSVSSGDQGGNLTSGVTRTGNIYTGDVDGWTFTASAGDRAIVSLGETGVTDGLSPWLRVVGPDGAVVASNFGSVAAQVEFSAPAAGTYVVIVGSAGGGFTGTGDYLLTMIKAPGTLNVSAGDQGGPLVNGATHRGTVYTGDVDGWSFTAKAGDHAIVSVGETGATDGLSPWLRVIGPSGAVVASNFGSVAAQVELSSLAAGTYTVVVGSAGGGFTGSGDYLLTLARSPGSLTVSTGDDGGTLPNGVTRTGSIYDGDIDGWTFTANAGDPISVSLVEAGATSGFSPWLRVIGPNGTVVGSNFGFSSALVQFAAPAPGTYTVIVGSAGGGFTGSGGYDLMLVGSTAF
jgi:hypothetical protein